MEIGVSFCLLFYYCLREINSCACEKIKQNTSRNIKLSLLKRQLGYGIDGDTSDIFGSAVDEVPEFISPTTLLTKQKSNSTSRSAVSPVLTKPSSTSTAYVTGHSNCSCTMKNSSEEEMLRKLIKKYGIKIVPSRSESFRDDLSNINKTERTQEKPKVSTTTMVFNETQFELIKHEFEIDAGIRQACPYYKHVQDLDIEKMVGVWQLVYYKAEEDLACFKIFIKKTTPEGRKHYEQKFSNFNDTIDWTQCYLELNSVRIPREDRKHFLQGSTKNKGIIENIVLSEHTENGTKTITLQEQAPDQWLVSKDLLLMRDCDSGAVIIFSRLQNHSSRKELEEAMVQFGENGLNGTKPCVSETKENEFETKKYEILS